MTKEKKETSYTKYHKKYYKDVANTKIKADKEESKSKGIKELRIKVNSDEYEFFKFICKSNSLTSSKAFSLLLMHYHEIENS